MLRIAKNQLVHAVLVIAVVTLLAFAAQGAFFLSSGQSLSLAPDAHALFVDTAEAPVAIACGCGDPGGSNGGGGGCC